VAESVEAGKPFDLIFMDNVMPNLTGPKATRIIRTEHEYRGMIVALTGSVLDDEVQDFKNAGATLVLAKPIQKNDLERVLFGEFVVSSLGSLINSILPMARSPSL
jgi:osomolarity two-component system, sensor histidine kinase SLN1